MNADPRDLAISASEEYEHAATSIRRTAQLSAQLSRAKKEISYLSRELSRTETQVNTLLALDCTVTVEPLAADPGKPRQGAFVLLVSDTHVGERVDKAAVSGRNEFNPTIARKRFDKLIDGALWMIESWRSGKRGYGWGIDTAVVWLGGDLISNTIHEDLAESNFLSPTQEVLLAQEMCRKVLDSIAAHPGIKRVLVPTSIGNHGRTTKERRVSTSWANSYEYLLYRQLQKHYEGSKVSVFVDQNEFSRLNVYGTRLRFNHGDTFKFGGGVGGILVPAMKWLAKLDSTEKADVTCIGHWHSWKDHGNLVCNGSLIGYSAYAQRVAPYEPAAQACFLIDAKYGKRLSTQIICQT